MCGIAGKFNFADRAPVPAELIERMNTVQAHRGPDGSGIHLGPGVGLGHRRLSIIDVAGGHQPLANEDGQVWISFNGEIYNFPELRQQLEARGHQFRTNTDTEVIVHLYEDQGERCVESLRGMFAFALWDQRRETLLLARDRLGIKPLHYAVLENRSLVFGSEIKAVLADPAVPRRLDPEALTQYLHFLYVPTPRTMFAGIRKLPAAHVLIGNRQGIRLHRYWDLTYGRAAPPAPADCAARLHDLLRDTVRDHLISDVPLGAFLSGGVDSSSIVALMREAVAGPVLTSSIGFAEADYNELPFARLAADRFQTQHHDEVVAPNIHDLLPKLVRSFDEPYADSSAVPTFHVSAAARRHVTVALSGDGGDELFAGYRRFELERLEHRLRRRLGPLVGAGGLFRHLPRAWKFKGRNSLESLAVDPAVACARKHYLLIFTPEQQHQLLAPEFSASLAGFDPFCEFHRYYREAQAPVGDWLNRALYVDLKTYLADDILTKVDRMSMAVSLEVRPALLDHRVVEFVAGIPPALKLHGQTRKYILKQAMANTVPRPILDRPKQGFRMPVTEWLRGELRELADDLLRGATARQRGYFQPAAVDRIWQAHQSGRRDYGHQLWQFLMFELWHREYLDRT